MQNTLEDLNNHLFAQLERLDDEDLKGDKLKEEIQRSDALTSVSEQIINNGNLVMKALTLQADILPVGDKLPKMLQSGKDDAKKDM